MSGELAKENHLESRVQNPKNKSKIATIVFRKERIYQH